MDDPEVDFLIAPVNSDFSMIAKAIVEPRQKILLAHSAGTLPVTIKLKMTFGLATDRFYSNGTWCFAVLTPSPR